MFRRLKLTHKILLSYMALLMSMVVLTSGLILPMRLAEEKQKLGEGLLDTALIFSLSPEIIEGVENGALSEFAVTQLDNVYALGRSTGYIVIADRNGTRLYHPEHWRIGEPFIGGDEAPILAGAAPYTSEAVGTQDNQLRAFQPVKNAGGEIIGFVMVSHSMNFIRTSQRRLLVRLVSLGLLMLGVGVIVAWVLSANIRRILLGNDPSDFVQMFIQREELLNQLGDGLVVLDETGRVIYENSAGRAFFSPATIEAEPELLSAFRGCIAGEPPTNRDVELDGKTYIFSMVPLKREKTVRMVLLILRDRTDVVNLTEQVTGFHHIVDALRAKTHEFLNKLHVVSGLIQVGRTDEAVRYIGLTSDEIESDYHTVVRQIQDSAVAALILGKISRAKELGLRFDLRKDSFLPADNGYLTTQELITVVGNLVENAFDATGGTWGAREITLYIGCDETGLQIVTDDTGRGMQEEQIQEILSSGYTSKGAGHGYGLRLVRRILDNRGGFLQIDSAPGEGTSVSILIRPKTSQTEKEVTK